MKVMKGFLSYDRNEDISAWLLYDRSEVTS